MSFRCSRRACFAGPAAALGVVLLAFAWAGAPSLESVQVASQTPDDLEKTDVLAGLWTRYEGTGEGDPVRFYYFHGDGHGLYRYGKVGLNKTNSFDYEVEGGVLRLRFRKTGDEHETNFVIADDDRGRYMELERDPRDSGVRYRRVRGPLTAQERTIPDPARVTEDDASGHAPLGGRFWIDYRPFATGGSGFAIYQLAPTALDGRGVGWFHRGDFDDWSTETLTYRLDGSSLELFFDLAEQPAVTRFDLEDVEGGRVLRLDSDPRDYWQRHTYKDGGKSFSGEAFGAVVGAAFEFTRPDGRSSSSAPR